MNAVLPHALFSIVRKDGIAEQTMRAWMQTITDEINFLQVTEGAGSPEGVLLAPKHKLYFNTSGAPGTFYYRKTTDETVNTGWVAIG
jgi:hypothetical protein